MMDCIEDLQCCVCIQVYSDKSPPKNLPCGHSACSSCLEKIMEDNRECPECRKPLKCKDVKDFSVNIPLLRLCRLHKFVTCEVDDLPPVDLNIQVPEAKPLHSEGDCPSHGHPQFFFCMPCDALVCRGCLISDHPDQPYGRCIIKSVEEKRQKKITLHVEALEKPLGRSKEMRKKLEQLHKGCKIAVDYWDKRPDDQKNEEQLKNLEEARSLLEEVKSDLDTSIQWNEFFSDATKNLKEARTLGSIDSLAESTKEKIPEFEKFEVPDRKDTLLKMLDKFWNGIKFPLS